MQLEILLKYKEKAVDGELIGPDQWDDDVLRSQVVTATQVKALGPMKADMSCRADKCVLY